MDEKENELCKRESRIVRQAWKPDVRQVSIRAKPAKRDSRPAQKPAMRKAIGEQ